ncbi:hypothetical protein FisN_4Lu576 [Fistulifera solaris]|uniref:Importin subunit alpha n=1 Tax=Fistulifera solaris TaxID=1519565 RepID=A0A1Z5JYX9_FISSO|nr:hypothetical protein FisN_4Lu576 [Fistulifera solaris]|eukprot:GAX19230.1 hypothetical protein FisN_4Lu576 [Fistulifera solaris]
MSDRLLSILMRLLARDDDSLRDDAVSVLGEIADDSIAGRDSVLRAGAMQALLSQFNYDSTVRMMRKATLTLSRFCRGVPRPDFELVRLAVPTLAELLHYPDEEVVTDACWAINYISDSPEEYKQAVIDAGIIPHLLAQLRRDIKDIQTPALMAIGSIASGNPSQTQCVIDNDALPCLLDLLSSSHVGIRKYACWAISNVTAGSAEQIQAVINCNIILPLVQLLSNFRVRRQAAYAIYNATSGGSRVQILHLVEQGCIRPLCDLLTVLDVETVTIVLKTLQKLLMIDDELSRRFIVMLIEGARGHHKIKQLRERQIHNINKKVFDILQIMYCGGGEQEEEIEVINVDSSLHVLRQAEGRDNVVTPTDTIEAVSGPLALVPDAAISANVDVQDSSENFFMEDLKLEDTENIIPEVQEETFEGTESSLFEPPAPAGASEVSLGGLAGPSIPVFTGKVNLWTTAATAYVRDPTNPDRKVRVGCPLCPDSTYISLDLYRDSFNENYDPDGDGRLVQQNGMYSHRLDLGIPLRANTWVSAADVQQIKKNLWRHVNKFEQKHPKCVKPQAFFYNG